MNALTLRGLFAGLTLALASTAYAVPNQIDFQIQKGSHVDRQGLGLSNITLGKRTRSLSFKVLFPASAVYRTANPANQSDSNKLMGLSGVNIHGTSLRLGWSYNPATNKMVLRLYAYVKTVRVNQVVAEVPLNTWVDVELRLGNEGMSTRVGTATYNHPVSPGLGALTPISVLKTAYFGGDETAPQNITVHVRDISFR